MLSLTGRPDSTSTKSRAWDARVARVHVRISIRMGMDVARHVQGKQETHRVSCSSRFAEEQRDGETSASEANILYMRRSRGYTSER